MRNILYLFIFLTSMVKAQTSYPYLSMDSNNGYIVVLTLEQAQKLDNATEFSPSLWKENSDYFKMVDSLCNIKLIKKDLVIDSILLVNKKLSIKMDSLIFVNNELNSQIELNCKKINYLENNVEIHKLENEKFNIELSEKNKIIKKKTRDLNVVVGFGIITGILTLIFLN